MIIHSIEELQKIIQHHKSQGKKIVWTNGCFDIIHPGHIKTFEFAKEKGDIVVVGINSDRSPYRATKPGRPINNQTFRETMIDSLKYVDYVIAYDEETPIEPIKAILPDALVKGGDYEGVYIVGTDEVIGNGGHVFTRIMNDNEPSTSEIVKKILSTYSQ